MNDMQKQLSEIMGDPEMMQKLSTIAQSLGLGSAPGAEANPSPPPISGIGDIDPSMLQKISGIVSNTAIDGNQRNLLAALSPYLSRDRIHKLEKAMRAAKLASMASVFLSSSSLSFFAGR